MNDYQYELREAVPDTEAAIEEALAGKPRAHELALLCEALRERIRAFKRDREATTNDLEVNRLSLKIIELRNHLKVLRQEESITHFVENSIRVLVAKSEIDDGY